MLQRQSRVETKRGAMSARAKILLLLAVTALAVVGLVFTTGTSMSSLVGSQTSLVTTDSRLITSHEGGKVATIEEIPTVGVKGSSVE